MGEVSGAIFEVARDLKARTIAAEARRAAEKATRPKRVIGQPKIAQPTPEQEARAPYRLESVKTERGQVVGRAYRRHPWFETLVERERNDARKASRDPLLTDDSLRALRYYRDAYEAGERSETRCALNRENGGGGHRGDGPSLALLRARETQRLCERDLGGLLHTLRAVAINDMTYANLAMNRYGSRDVDMIIDGRSTTKPAPKSGRHVAAIKDEFVAAVGVLLATVKPYLRTGD